MNTHNHEEKFSRILLNPLEWKKIAECLIESAKLLEPKIKDYWKKTLEEFTIKTDYLSKIENYLQVYIMLYSYALENLFKAIIVQKNKDKLKTKIKSKKVLPSILKRHKLYPLAKEEGLDALDAAEESMLKRLTRSAVWYGRYPVPVKPGGLEALQKSEENNSTISLSYYSSSDCEDIQRIVVQVSSRLSAIMLD